LLWHGNTFRALQVIGDLLFGPAKAPTRAGPVEFAQRLDGFGTGEFVTATGREG
jgi:hypothetical protein